MKKPNIIDKVVIGLVAAFVICIASMLAWKQIANMKDITRDQRKAEPDILPVQGINTSAGVNLLYRRSTAEYLITLTGHTNKVYSLYAQKSADDTNKVLLMTVTTTVSPEVVFPLSTPVFLNLVKNKFSFDIQMNEITPESYE